MRLVIDLQADAAFDLQRFGEKILLGIERPPILAAVNSDLQRFERAGLLHLCAE